MGERFNRQTAGRFVRRAAYPASYGATIFSARPAAAFVLPGGNAAQRKDCMNQFCSACGTALEEGAQFCAKCGKPASGGEAAAGQTGGAGTAGFTWPTGERLKVLLFAVFLGLFGVHCFYTGRRIRGFIELLLGLGGMALMIAYPFTLKYGNMSASDIYAGSTYDFASPVYAPIFVAALAFIVFAVLWIMDVFKIFQGRFDKVESALTKKHLLFLGVLLGLQIIGFIPGLGQPISLLREPAVYLSGVFFGLLPGTVIAGLLTLIGKVLNIPTSPVESIFYVLRACIVTAVTALIVYRYQKIRSPEGKPALKLPDISGKPVLQGVLIGAACLAASVIAFLLIFLISRFTPLGWVDSRSFSDILYAATAGLIGAALPPLLAKKGLYLGPFVTPERAAGGQASSGTAGTV
jgi:TM2 domain-containing membrane protein YozV